MRKVAAYFMVVFVFTTTYFITGFVEPIYAVARRNPCTITAKNVRNRPAQCNGQMRACVSDGRGHFNQGSCIWRNNNCECKVTQRPGVGGGGGRGSF